MEQTDKVLKRVIWGLVCAVIVYACFGLWADAGAVFKTLSGLPLWIWGVALGLSVLNYMVRFFKWQLYLNALSLSPDRKIAWWHSLFIFLAGLMMSITPGKLGEVFKSYLLKTSHGVEMARTAPIVVAERLTDVIALLILSSAGLLLFDYGRWAFIICGAGVVFGVFALTRQSWIQWVLARMQTHTRLAPLAGRAQVAFESIRVLLTPKLLGTTALMSVFSWAMEALAFGVILWHIPAQNLTWMNVSFLYAMSTLIGAISFLPGGLGVTEAGMIGGLQALDVLSDRNVATAATASIRLATLWFGVCLGGVCLVLWRRFVRR